MSRQFPAAPPAPSTPLLPVGNPAPSQTLLNRTGDFISKNKNVIILGTAVAVSAGVGYYLYTKPTSPSGGSSSPDSKSTKSSSSEKKKAKKNKKKGLSGEGLNGPLLEEIQPTPSTTQEEKKEVKPDVQPDIFADVPTGEALTSMSEAERNKLGSSLKEKGNSFYSKRDYSKAIECYTKAIDVSVKRDPVFFSNRAACYNNVKPPQYEKVVEDCNEALSLDKTYAKALKRRAGALEHLDRLEEAIRDFTATTIIEGFRDQVAGEGMERVLQNLVVKKFAEHKANKELTLPGNSFISQYLSAFRPRDKPTLPENPSQGDQTLDLAFDALTAQDYAHSLSFTNEAIEQGVSSKEGQAEAYNLRGTFRFLMSDSNGAAEDFEKSISIHPTSIAWTKLAAVHMELGDRAKAFGDFESAKALDPTDADLYYHRGQIYFITEDWNLAMKDYEQSIKLDDTFIFSHIQHAMCQYKLENLAGSQASFRKILKQFPDRSEAYNYYGEILLDQQKHKEAEERFDKAWEMEQSKPKPNVTAKVNKAYCLVHWKQDFATAKSLCEEAYSIDSASDVAAGTLAQISLQLGNLEDAITWFERHFNLARSDAEATAALQFLEAAKAQKAFITDYPELRDRLNQPPPGMAM